MRDRSLDQAVLSLVQPKRVSMLIFFFFFSPFLNWLRNELERCWALQQLTEGSLVRRTEAGAVLNWGRGAVDAPGHACVSLTAASSQHALAVHGDPGTAAAAGNRGNNSDAAVELWGRTSVKLPSTRSSVNNHKESKRSHESKGLEKCEVCERVCLQCTFSAHGNRS